MFCRLYNLFCLTVNHDGQPSFLETAVLMTVHAKDVRFPYLRRRTQFWGLEIGFAIYLFIYLFQTWKKNDDQH